MSVVRKPNTVERYIEDHDYWLAKYRFIQERFPGCRVSSANYLNKPQWITFASKKVNTEYTSWSITHDRNWYSIWIEPYTEMEFEYLNKKETIRVHSSPKQNKLATRFWTNDKGDGSCGYIIKFSKIRMNLERRGIATEKLFNDCKLAIVEFIRKNEGAKLDTSNLDPSLKRLLAFM